MIIDKIVVPEVVDKCWRCPFSSDNLDFCYAMDRDLNNNGEKRPDWCPLVTRDECFEWMFFRVPVTPRVMRILKGEYIPEDIKEKSDKE